MQTARRYDPTKDAKFHVSIATTEEIRRKWATPRPEWTGPKGTVQPASMPDENSVTETGVPTQSGDTTIGLSPDFKIAGRSRTPDGPRRSTADQLDAGLYSRRCGALGFRTVPSSRPKGTVQSTGTPDENTATGTVEPTQSGNAVARENTYEDEGWCTWHKREGLESPPSIRSTTRNFNAIALTMETFQYGMKTTMLYRNSDGSESRMVFRNGKWVLKLPP